MKVLYIVPHGDLIYGGERSLLQLIGELKTVDMAIGVICPQRGVFSEALTALGVEVETCKLTNFDRETWLEFVRSVFHLGRKIINIRPDLIHCNSSSVAQLAVPIARLLAIPLVVHVRTELTPREAVRNLVPFADAVICNTSFSWEKLSAVIDERRQFTVYNPVALPKADVMVIHKNEGIPKILFVGQICALKGVEIFLHVAARIAEIRSRRVLFAIVGGEPYHALGYRKKMQRLAAELGIEELVRFIGHSNDVYEHLADCAILVVPSEKETFGRIAAEAMAVGVPVVAAEVGGLKEVVSNNQSGFLVPRDDVEAYTTKIAFLLENTEVRTRMGKAGVEKVKRLFSPHRHGNIMIAIYRALTFTDAEVIN